MIPPDTREQARAMAHGLLGWPSGPNPCNQTEHHDECDRLTDYILARDAAHAAEVAGWNERSVYFQGEIDNLEGVIDTVEAERDAARAEVAMLTADVERLNEMNHFCLARARDAEAECATLRSRLSTVERERDEGKGLLKTIKRYAEHGPSCGDCEPELAECDCGHDAMVEEIDAYLSRSPVEGGLEMVTPSGELPESTSAASEGETFDPWSMERHDRFPGSGPRDDSWRILARSDELRWKQYETTARPPYVAVALSEANARAIVTAHNAQAAAPETRDMKTREGT